MTDIKVAISTVKDGNMLNRDSREDRDVIANRTKFLSSNGISINDTTLVRIEYAGDNYTRYKLVGEDDKGKGMCSANLVTADALVTKEFGHALFLPIADCVGVVLFDPIKSVLMLSHIGRHSILQEGGEKSVKYLSEKFGCEPKDIKIWLSPAPGRQNYPLFARNNRSLKDVLYEQLAKAGVSTSNITDNTADSSLDHNYFSHSEFLKGNRDEDGRFAIVAMMQ